MSPAAASGGGTGAPGSGAGADPEGGDASPGTDRAYREALARHGVRDVQPGYRALLVQLKKADPDAYEAAVARYTEDVAPRASSEGSDPLRVWVEYGMWLAARLHPGEAVTVDRTGRSAPVEGSPPLGPLILHLPGEKRRKAVPVAVPEEPSGPQRATLELLCG